MATRFEPLAALLAQHEYFAGNVADRVLGGYNITNADTTLYGDFAEQLNGLVFGEPGHDPNPVADAYEPYAAAMREAFPELGDFAPFNPPTSYYNAMEAALRALEQVDGDLADGAARFHAALAELEFETPVGHIALDANRSAVGRAVASQFTIDAEGQLIPVNFHRIDGVEQTYNGYFAPDSPEPGQDGPECVAGDPPAWALASGSGG